jgi:hypothetical protein
MKTQLGNVTSKVGREDISSYQFGMLVHLKLVMLIVLDQCPLTYPDMYCQEYNVPTCHCP